MTAQRRKPVAKVARRRSGATHARARRRPPPAQPDQYVFADMEARERRFRALIENSADAITLLGADGTVIHDTAAAPGMLGYGPEELIGLKFFQLVHPDDLPRVAQAFAQVAGQPGSRISDTFRVRHKSGRWLWLEAVASNLLDDPSVNAIVVNYGDITARKQFERERERYSAELDRLYRALGALFTTGANIAQLGDTIVSVVTREFNVADCGVMMLDPGGLHLIRLARAGEYDVLTTAPLPLTGDGLTVNAARSGQMVYAPDVSADPRYIANVPTTRSELALPLRVGERVIGVLDLQSPQHAAFDEDTRRVLTAFAERAALALEHARLLEETRRQAIEAETLRQAGAVVASALKRAQAIELILEQLARVVPCDSASVQLLQDGYLEIVGGRGWADIRQVLGLRFPIPGDNPNTQVIQQREPLILTGDSRRYPAFHAEVSGRVRSWMGVPLVVRGRTIGMITLDRSQTAGFSGSEARLATAFADQVAVALENARLFEEAQQRAEQFAALYTISREFAEQQDLEQLLRTVVEHSAELLHAPSSAIMLFEADRQELVLSVVTGVQKPLGTRLRLGEGMAGRVAQTRQPLIVDDYRTWEGRSPQYEGLPLSAAVQVPMLSGGEFVGVLDVSEVGDTARRFTAVDADLLSLLAAQAANAIHRTRLFEETRRRADDLAAVAAVSAALRAADTRAEMLPIILDQVLQLVQADGTAIDTYDAVTQEAVVELGRGVWAPGTGRRAPLTAGVAGPLLATRQPYVTADIHADNVGIHDDLNAPVKAVAALPLAAHGEIMGALWVGRIAPFTPDEIRVVAAVADMAANALHRAALHEQTHQRAEQLAAVNHLARALSETLDVQQIYERLADAVMRLLPDSVTLFISLFDSGQSLIRCGFGVQDGERLDPAALPPIPLEPPGVGTQSEAIRTRQPLIVNDLNERLKHVRTLARVGTPGPVTQSGLYVPMLAQDQVIGVVQVQSLQLNRYAPSDAELLGLVANTAAVAIQNARLFEAERRRRREAESLRDAAAALSTALELQQVLDRILTHLADVIPYDSAAVLMLEADSVRVVAGRGFPNPQQIIGQAFTADTPLNQEILRSSRPVILADAGADPRFGAYGGTTYVRGWMGVPLITRNNIIGFLTLDSRRAGAYGAAEAALAQAFANQAAAALENARLFSETTRRLDRLQALRAIDLAITASVDLRVTLTVLLDHVTSQLRVDAADILLLNPHTSYLEYAAGRGFRTRGIERSRLRLGEGHAGQAALERRIVSIPDTEVAGFALSRAPLLAGEGFRAYYGVPLTAKGQVKGVLDIFHRAPLAADSEWLDFLDSLASQAAIALDNAALFDEQQRYNVELTVAYDATIEGWSRALDLRDKETEGHTQRVTEMSVQLAQALGIPDASLVQVRRGALLHDIGKMGVPDAILLKPGPLTDEEWRVMRMHPVYAYQMLSPIAFLRSALDIPYCHHEKWDGSGYPRALRGENIPLVARAFAVVDVWDALCSDRPYRKGWPVDDVEAYLRQQSGKYFDPQVVEVFLKLPR